jgi:hypothetical protein
VIQGSEALYMVHREFRTPPSTTGGVHPFPKGSEAAAKAFMDARAQANAYLANSVYLCGDRGPDPRCRGR